MSDLEKHFPTEMNLLKQIDNKFKKSQNEIKELNEIVKQLKTSNLILQESEEKLDEKLNNYNNQTYKDVKVMNDYYKYKNENEILKTEKESLKIMILSLEQKIQHVENENKRNIENIKNNFKIKEKSFEEQIASLEASNTLDIFEKENDIKKIKYDYEQKLQIAIKREQNLKIELFDLKHQTTSSISALNKEIAALQEKNKQLDNNQQSSTSSNLGQRNTSFISAKNILNISNTSSCGLQKSLINNKMSTNQLNNNTQIQNTVNINSIEINPVKRFQFRKPKDSAKILLSEDFDPFKMHKETTAYLNVSNNSCNVIETSLIEEADDKICEKNQKYVDYNEDVDCYIVQPNSSENGNNCSSSLPKKRKLFNPNNFDYLN